MQQHCPKAFKFTLELANILLLLPSFITQTFFIKTELIQKKSVKDKYLLGHIPCPFKVKN